MKDLGYKAICFDKDNVLTVPYSFHVQDYLAESINIAVSLFNCSVVSNSVFEECFIYNKSKKLKCLPHFFRKPFCGNTILKHYKNLTSREIVVIGDRIFTDILMANMHGFLSILIEDPLCKEKEHFGIKAARLIEKCLSSIIYYRNNRKNHHELDAETLSSILISS